MGISGRGMNGSCRRYGTNSGRGLNGSYRRDGANSGRGLNGPYRRDGTNFCPAQKFVGGLAVFLLCRCKLVRLWTEGTRLEEDRIPYGEVALPGCGN